MLERYFLLNLEVQKRARLIASHSMSVEVDGPRRVAPLILTCHLDCPARPEIIHAAPAVIRFTEPLVCMVMLFLLDLALCKASFRVFLTY